MIVVRSRPPDNGPEGNQRIISPGLRHGLKSQRNLKAAWNPGDRNGGLFGAVAPQRVESPIEEGFRDEFVPSADDNAERDSLR